MVLLVMLVKWNLISVCLEIVLVSMQDRCTIASNVPLAQKPFWMHPMVLLGEIGRGEAHFGPFGDSVNLSAR
jgi:hypothetical protein